MKIIDKKEVVEQFKELLPWDKAEAFDEILFHMGENSIEDYLFKNGGYSPFDFTNAAECVEHYGADTLCAEMSDYEIEDYIKTRPSTCSAYCYIKALEKLWDWGRETYISETNIKKLEELLEEIKKEKK